MSMATSERAIWEELKEVTGNRKLKLKEMLEWSTGTIEPRDGETVVNCPRNGVNASVPAAAIKTPANAKAKSRRTRGR